jgi:hypothetical protein
MITIAYDPCNGIALRDSEVMGFAYSLADLSDTHEIAVGNWLIIDAIRLAVKHGVLDHKNITFDWGATIDADGRLSTTLDIISDRILSELL